MSCKIEKSKISGQIVCPSNKSYTHRAIFLASLAGNNSKVENILFSADTEATIEACKEFGAEIEIKESSIIVKNPIKFDKKPSKINCENSGTTIRIAAGISSLFSNEIILTGDKSLQKRPMQPLLEALSSIGAQCTSSNGNPPIKIKGKISGGDVRIAGNLSSQFISSLLITSPITDRGINLTIDGNLVSKPYIDATIATMRKFGITVHNLIPYKKYAITPQVYKNTTFKVPIDFSSLAILLAASVLIGENVTIKGDIGNLPQGDEVFIDILEQMGVKISINDEEIKIQAPEKLLGGTFDLSNSPDLLPPLSILSIKATTKIEIVNVKHARLKETDRIAIISRELKKIGIKVQEKEDGITLQKIGVLNKADLNAENDHRLFMIFCIVGMAVGGCTVTDPESVKVSFPKFIEEMNRLGGNIEF